MQPLPRLIHHLLERNARLRPDKVAVIDGEIRATYGQINCWANVLARKFVAGGLSGGDRVALFLENGVEFITAYFAALKTGGVAVPLCSELTPGGLARILSHIEPFALVTSARCGRSLCSIGSGVSIPVVVGRESSAAFGTAYIPWAGVFTDEAEDLRFTLDDGALAAIVYTSGSTGEPKGVMLSHRNVVANALSIVEYLRLTERDIQMVVLPFYYVMGKSLLTTHFAVGGTLVINNRFAFTAQLIDQMIGEKVTGFAGVPSTYAYLLHRSPLAEYRERLNHLRYCTQAGGHMPRRTKEELLRVLPAHTRLFIMYGATEAAARLAFVDPDRLREKIDSIGQPISGVVLSVRDDEGRKLPDGEVGEIVANGPNIMLGYWKDEAGTSRVLGPYGYRTGDLGYRDPEGFFHVCGRKDNLMKIGGHRINPKEVEEALMGTDLLVEVTVLGVRDELLESRLVALAAAKSPDCSERDILRRCVKVLPRYKLPSAVGIVESLPKTPHGKLDAEKCRELARNCLLLAGNGRSMPGGRVHLM